MMKRVDSYQKSEREMVGERGVVCGERWTVGGGGKGMGTARHTASQS